MANLKTKLIATGLAMTALSLQAQNTPVSQMEKLDRGLIALPAQKGTGNFVSWRSLGTDVDSLTQFEILRNGESLVKDQYLTNYTDASGKRTDTYQIVTFVSGQPVDTTAAVKPWSLRYQKLVLKRPAKGPNGGNYDPNDCSVGDVDGDGEYEIFVKWNPSNAKDNSQGGITDNVLIDCYKLNGTLLWRIDLGRNIRAGAHYTQYMVYDFDGDGRAEMMCKTGPGSLDSQGQYVNSVATDEQIRKVPGTALYRNNDGRITGGQEWLTVFNGETGQAIHTIFYNPNRNTTYGGEADGSFNWDDRSGRSDYASYGNRGERFLAGVAQLDGPDKPASGIFCRGYYTYAFIWAVDFDGQQLHQKWLNAAKSRTSYKLTTYDADGKGTTQTYSGLKPTSGGGSGTIYGNGNHNMAIADVDGDGCDEVVWGASAVDHDGKLLYGTGFGHGDALHLSDLNPLRPGLEMFQVHEGGGTYAWDIHDAATGEVLLKGGPSGVDNGRGIAVQLDPNYYGFFFNSGKDKSQRSAVTGEVMSNGTTSNNFRVYWDGDLQDELLDGSKVDKWNGNGTSRLVSFGDIGPSSTCNGSKNTPCLSADILGDWREEVILYRASDAETCLAIYSTNIPSNYRVPTLMHDHTYRMAICWQNTAYNQPPHLGYYLADNSTPSMSNVDKRFVVRMEEPVDWTFNTTNTTKIEQNYYTLDGEKYEGMPEGVTYAIEGDKNPTLTVKGAFTQKGNYTLAFTLTGTKGHKLAASIKVLCLSNEVVTGVTRRWDFTQWSLQTVNNLTAEADADPATGWSDIEYYNGAGTERPAATYHKCFWLQSEEGGSVRANGEKIRELEGLVFSDDYCAGRSLAIAVDYPSTDIGNYAGPQYLWLGINSAPYCFYIPNVIVGQPVSMAVESHRSGQGRGVGIYVADDSGTLHRIGDDFTPDSRETQVWADWTLPEGVTDLGGHVDIYVKNTSGCHLYFIETVVADDGTSGITETPVLRAQSPVIYNLRGQRVVRPQKGLYIVDGKKRVLR
ncbi:MAG: rhamnogalacturonan lyase [Prevotella sp.]|nr:rhamnogalacturonan lyase [Prevotella sp.]